MNSDFRVLVTLPTHPKTKKLMRQLGDRSFYNLIRLWAWVAQNKPEGELSNMEKDDIEIAADWHGEDGLFVDTLIDLKFIDCAGECCNIHDWQENNGYAAAAKKRSDKARKAALARWNGSCDSANECSEHCSDMQEHDLANAPSPSPSPSPKPYKFILKDKSFYRPDEEYIGDLQRLYPLLDMDYQFAEIEAWCLSNEGSRKTKRGAKKFINGWFSRSNKKAMSEQETSTPNQPRQKIRGLEQAHELYD